ncbi:YqgE/AlgH family protein [Yunchengibacter salinarum]|uniref:YqgE/AlgH family protein n=1 Tax=Yunchengibacter salinarum TaxID=3133399 RepID=UPI0035B64DF0
MSSTPLPTGAYLTGSLLLAMPGMDDTRFESSVIYICSHDDSGAMGLVINQSFPDLSFQGLLQQLDIPTDDACPDTTVHLGGPVEPGRGFVLHSADYAQESTLIVSESMALSATIDILQEIAAGRGPAHHLVALGYAGWGPGQLEQEIQHNGWLTASADEEIVFNTDLDHKWPRAMRMLGIEPAMLSTEAGHA